MVPNTQSLLCYIFFFFHVHFRWCLREFSVPVFLSQPQYPSCSHVTASLSIPSPCPSISIHHVSLSQHQYPPCLPVLTSIRAVSHLSLFIHSHYHSGFPIHIHPHPCRFILPPSVFLFSTEDYVDVCHYDLLCFIICISIPEFCMISRTV